MYCSRAQLQKQRNPCLSDLDEYLQQPPPALDRSRIVCLDVFECPQPATRRDIAVQDLLAELRGVENRETAAEPDRRKGRILLIEDISSQTIEELGSFFDIEPLFFASYIHQTWRKTSTHSPTTCSLPSRDRKQGFLPLQYHRIVTFQQSETKLRSLTRNCNHKRKVVILPIMAGEQVGLIQHCCSTLLMNRPGQEWIGMSFRLDGKALPNVYIGIVLLDPPISNNYVPSKRHSPLPPNLESFPLLGGCEDFSPIPIAQLQTQAPWIVSNRSMLDELVHHWTHQTPPMFSASSPTLQALSYYPLRIVAAEWVNYVFVLGMSLREYELSTTLIGDLTAELEKLNITLRILQGWRRRILSTQGKMRRTIRFVKNHRHPGKPSEDWDALEEDYEFLHTEVTEHGERLEAMVPLVTSAAALIESRRSLYETANVTRLTILALVFVPLSYIASIFSMADDFGPGGARFWVYFATAIPLASAVWMFAKLPRGSYEKFVAKVVERKARATYNS